MRYDPFFFFVENYKTGPISVNIVPIPTLSPLKMLAMTHPGHSTHCHPATATRSATATQPVPPPSPPPAPGSSPSQINHPVHPHILPISINIHPIPTLSPLKMLAMTQPERYTQSQQTTATRSATATQPVPPPSPPPAPAPASAGAAAG
jgi:hypothetical protein